MTMGKGLRRREFVDGALAAACVTSSVAAVSIAHAVEARGSAAHDSLPPLPLPDPDPESPFGVDCAVNVDNVDEYLLRPDVTYRDCRMLFDPADWWAMDGNPDLSSVLEGFKVVPYPYLGTLPALPMDGAYDGETLYKVTWDDSGSQILAAEPAYEESRQVLDDLYPKGTPIFLVCGGGGYAGFTKKLLAFLGWDESLLYNLGGMWDYRGERLVHIIEYGATEADDVYALWRADYANIDFSLLHPLEDGIGSSAAKD